MTLTIHEISGLARVISEKAGRPLELHSVTASDGGSDRVELLLTLSVAGSESRRVLLNVSRAGAGPLEMELTAKLHDLL